jgi:hypothetical protein
MSFTVFVDDNFHYMDEDERYKLGEYETLDAALAACRGIVDEFLATNHKPGMSADELLAQYKGFGEDPFIMGAGAASPFSAWTYAQERCKAICQSTP